MIRALRLTVLAAGVAALAAAAEARPAQGGWLFTTFKGEATPDAEQIYFGLSPDGFHWNALNRANPVLVSAVGEKGVRDSYLVRARDGKKFYLLATDLSLNLSRNWARARRAGSQSIVIWESDDLVKWSAPRLAKVAPDDAGCAWAPEAIYDDRAKNYLVYWASTTGRDHFAKQRIWSARTTDFKEFSPPEIYIEKPANVIDTDIIRAGNGYYRFSKDDRNKDITMEAAGQLAGPWTDVTGFTLDTPLATRQRLEGPEAFQFAAATAENREGGWCLLLDYPGRGYRAFLTADLASGKFTPSDDVKFPFVFRHGSILRLSPDEYERLKSADRVEWAK